MRLRTVTIRPETGGEEKRDRAKWQAKIRRFLRYILTLTTLLVLGCRSAWPQPPQPVVSVVWSPDGKRLAAAIEGAAFVWDAETGKELLSLSLRSGISSIAWSPDSRRLAAAAQDNTVTVWDAETGGELLTLGHYNEWAYGESVSSVAWSPDGKRLATGNGSLPRRAGQDVKNPFDVAKVWDAETGKELLALNGHTHGSCEVAWSPNGKRLATGTEDGVAKVWDAESGQELLTLSSQAGRIFSMTWNPDGKRLAAGSCMGPVTSACGDGTTTVWDAESGQELLALSAHNEGVSSVALNPNGRSLATGSFDGRAKVWDAETGQEVVMLNSHSGGVFSVAWSPDGRRLVTGSECATVKIWDAGTGKELLKVNGFQGCEEMSEKGGPNVTLGIEISLPDSSVFYVPVVGNGEILGTIPVSTERFAGIRITPRMGEDRAQIEVSALVTTGKRLSEAGCDEIRSWQSVDAGSYEGRKDESLALSGLAALGLPVLKVKVVGVKGPPPGGGYHPYAGYSSYCSCESWLTPGKCSERRFGKPERATPCTFLGCIGAGKCVQFSGCGQCCRIVLPSDASDVLR
jgi:WD40 repeat protein